MIKCDNCNNYVPIRICNTKPEAVFYSTKYGGKLCSTACAVSYIKRIKSVYNSENGKVRPTSTSG